MKTFIYLFILIPYFIFSQEKVKYWSEIDTLQFEDFKSKSINNKKMYAVSNLALEIVSIDDSKIINVLPVFSFERSFYPKNSTGKYGLKHEQLHFDILELYARKIRKELIEYYRKTYDTNLDTSYKIYDKYLIEYLKYDDKYDIETNHSIIIEKQIEWNNKVKKELEKYKDYTSKKYLEYIDDL